MKINGKTVYEGPSQVIMGDPWQALLWLVNNAARRGIALEEDQIVLAGSVGIVNHSKAEVLVGDHFGDCGALGQVRLRVVQSASPR
jgi:2-keto-4-pentenoate hydratase